MARESIEERRVRLGPGAQWLAAQRESRGLSGRELARRLGINPDRIFAYERAQDEPGKDFIALLAAEYGLPEVDIWRGLQKALPAEFEDDDAMVAYWVERKGEDFFRRVLAHNTGRHEGGDTGESVEDPGSKRRHSGIKPKGVTRKSGGEADQAPGSRKRA